MEIKYKCPECSFEYNSPGVCPCSNEKDRDVYFIMEVTEKKIEPDIKRLSFVDPHFFDSFGC
jgi:hypothetical protein